MEHGAIIGNSPAMMAPCWTLGRRLLGRVQVERPRAGLVPLPVFVVVLRDTESARDAQRADVPELVFEFGHLRVDSGGSVVHDPLFPIVGDDVERGEFPAVLVRRVAPVLHDNERLVQEPHFVFEDAESRAENGSDRRDSTDVDDARDAGHVIDVLDFPQFGIGESVAVSGLVYEHFRRDLDGAGFRLDDAEVFPLFRLVGGGVFGRACIAYHCSCDPFRSPF